MSDAQAAYAGWLDEVASKAPFGEDDRLGTANLIDAAARLRGAAAVTTGQAVSLARPLDFGPAFGEGEDAISVDLSYDTEHQFASDRVGVECHGFWNTHLDAANHISGDGRFYRGRTWDDPELSSVVDLAEHGLFTRGVIADIPALRGTDWVSAEEPVTGADFEAATAEAGFRPGDALIAYMGRDRWEAAGHRFGHQPADEHGEPGRRPGIGADGARWIAENGVSVLAWDFLDAVYDVHGPVHQLLWAIGLATVDNCDLGPVAAAARDAGKADGAFVVLPVSFPKATGCLVNPFVIL